MLLKIRAYQDEIADVVHIYEKEEVSRLYEMGEITQLDPVLHLPPEVLYTVLNYMEDERTTATLSLVSCREYVQCHGLLTVLYSSIVRGMLSCKRNPTKKLICTTLRLKRTESRGEI